MKFIKQDPFYLSCESEGEIFWSILQGEDDPLDLLFDEYRNSARKFLEWALAVEIENWLGYKPYERGEDRPNPPIHLSPACFGNIFRAEPEN